MPTAAATAAALTVTAVLALAGCDSDTPGSAALHRSGPTTAPTAPAGTQGKDGAHGVPMIPATESAPALLGGPYLFSSAPVSTLPPARSVASNSRSIPWGLVNRDVSTGILTVQVEYGGCTPRPFGYTAITHQDTVVIAIYSNDIVLPSGDGCSAVGELAVYRLVLPPADAKLSPAHAPYS
jgi:hypothetical protein